MVGFQPIAISFIATLAMWSWFCVTQCSPFTGFATCELGFVGRPSLNRTALLTAKVICTGGNVTAAIHEDWLQSFLDQGDFQGVTWDIEGCYHPECLFTVCAETNALFTQFIVKDVFSLLNLGIFCVMGKSNVTVKGGKVVGNRGSTAFGVAGTARVTISGSVFAHNVARDMTGIGLCVWEDAVVTIANGTLFESNVAVGRSGGAITVQDNAVVTISNSTVRNCSANSAAGGAILAEGNATITIADGSEIGGNAIVNGEGGAIAVLDTSRIFLFNTRLIGNNATYGSGGAIYADYDASVVIDDRCTLRNNTSSFSLGGGALALGGNATARITGASQLVENVAELSSGGAVSITGNASLLLAGSTVISDNYATLYGGGLYVVQDAVANITGGVLVTNNTSGNSGQDISASADGSLILGDTNINISSPTLYWSRIICVVGEVKSPATGYCMECGLNSYSLDPAASSCQVCPTNANCTGRDIILPLEGYWHSHKYSTQVHSCPISKNCQYGGRCAMGHTGHACGNCEFGYGMTSPLECGKCRSRQQAWMIYVLGALLVVIVLSILVHTTVNDNLKGCSSSNKLRPSHFLKIFVRHLQYLVVLSSVHISWPAFLSLWLTASGWLFNVNYAQGVSLDCVLPLSSIPRGVDGLMVCLAAPLAVLLCVLLLRAALRGGLIFLASKMGKQCSLLPPFRVDVVVSSLVALFFFYPFWVRASLSMFACYGLDSNSRAAGPYPEYAIANARFGYWVSNMNQACWEGWHLRWAVGLGVPCVLILVIGVPLGFWWYLHSNRNRLGASDFMVYGSFLVHDYTSRRYDWEVYNSIQIGLVMAIPVFSFTLGSYYSCVLLNVAFAGYFVGHYILHPYASKELHCTSLGSLLCLYLTTVLALTFFTFDRVTPPAYGTAMGVLSVAGNAAFLAWCIYRAATQSSGVVSRLVGRLRQACFKVPCCKRAKKKLCGSQTGQASHVNEGHESQGRSDVVERMPQQNEHELGLPSEAIGHMEAV